MSTDLTLGYGATERAEIAELLSELLPGEWGQVGLCYGTENCPYKTEEDNFCPICRIIHVYRACA